MPKPPKSNRVVRPILSVSCHESRQPKPRVRPSRDYLRGGKRERVDLLLQVDVAAATHKVETEAHWRLACLVERQVQSAIHRTEAPL